MKIYNTFLLLIASFSSFAQTCEIKGVCLDRNNAGLEGVRIECVTSLEEFIYSSSNGQFVFTVNCGDTVDVLIYGQDAQGLRKQSVVVSSPTINLGKFKFEVQQEQTINVYERKRDPFDMDQLEFNDIQKIPMGGVEKLLVYSTAATSNNELTSNYTVRGGNYDENLVYVNGFQIYRPFLTRSGQQEGMSFVNTALVEKVSFSAGGFDAQYGDKLSSVLDIEYRTPTKFRASATASLLGVESHVEQVVGPRFNYLVGARYRANGYLLNALPAKGAYNPVFADAQFLTNYALTENLTWSVLGHFSSNDYRFAPQTQRTDFGTVNEAYSFTIYFEGQEKTRFLTGMGGTALKYEPSKKTKLDFYATAFRSVEREYFDIFGQYFINELETDPSKDEFGDSVAVLGIGSFLNHARNKLDATIYNVYHNGMHLLKEQFKNEEQSKFVSSRLLWGVNLQYDQFDDVLSEWKYIDSAGYSLPQSNQNEVELLETIKGNLQLETFRTTAFVQNERLWSTIKREVPVSVKYKVKDTLGEKQTYYLNDTLESSASRWALNLGTRAGYTQINEEFYVTPRLSLSHYPRVYMKTGNKVTRRDVKLRLATGLYYQPPFYREFRTFDGDLNLNVVSQKSFHAILGGDYYLNLWGRSAPFKLSADLFYKYLWDVNPYEIDNVRTRYFAENNAVAYAYGIDMNMNGQFIEGIESYFKMGLLRTEEDLLNDFYYDYYNQEEEKINFGFTNDDTPVDSVRVEPGFVPRPTDQLFTFGALIQDQMPNYESFSVQMGMQFGTRLPYGPPDRSRYKDTLRQKSYFRVDIGFSYDFLYKKKQLGSDKQTFWTKNFEDAILSFEVFNLLGIDNVLSKQWIQDVSGRYYSVPNNLTQRRFNLKLILRL
jgi:hypothetical protein